MRFLLGLIVGVALGAGGMYGALEEPWLGAAQVSEEPDAGVVAADSADKRKRRRRGRRGRRAAAAEQSAGAEVPALTEADRKMVWRGDKVALPQREVDFAADSGGRPLNSGEINAVVERQSQPVIGCITEARGDAPLDARIRLEMLVSGDGRVTKLRVRAPAYLFAHGFLGCARQAGRSLRFPATGAPTIVEVPYDLY